MSPTPRRRGRALIVLVCACIGGYALAMAPATAADSRGHDSSPAPAPAPTVSGTTPTLTYATGRPQFQMPFACGEQWAGSSRASHSPSPLSVDWNRDAYDEGHPVVATAPGIVTSVVDLGNASYGLYIVIDHGGDWSTLHAHLQRSYVVVGERVDQGQVIALLGDSGNSTGAHLHYEQRLDRTDQHASFAGASFVYNSWLVSKNCGDRPVVGDWDGNGLTDVGVYARRPMGGVFRELLPETEQQVRFGAVNDEPVVGDWDGDGQVEPGVWLPTRRTFVLSVGTGTESFPMGHRGDLPISGDWNGDGVTDVGLFHPATATFRLRTSTGVVTRQTFGSVSSLPIAGDWDGDGTSQVGVYGPAHSRFKLRLADGSTKTLVYGQPGSLPVVGRWNRDAVSDVGVWDSAQRLFSERFGPRHSKGILYGHRR